MSELFPENGDRIRKFVNEVQKTGEGLKKRSHPIKPGELLKHFSEVFCAVKYLNSTLQDVFDKFKLPQGDGLHEDAITSALRVAQLIG